MKITQERLKELLDYNSSTGIFTRKKDGKIVGNLNIARGYFYITLDGIPYRSHRLAWLYVYGGPVPLIYHKDGNKLNNATDNLRGCTKSGLKGIHKTSNITQERLKELLDYDTISGIFTRKKDGKIAGSLNSHGYIIITIDYIKHAAHRLAWLYVYGGPIPPILDHIDGDRSNNAIDNLRSCTTSENAANQSLSTKNTSGFKGVCYSKHKKKWKAEIRRKYKNYHLGYYLTKEEAYEAYCAAAIELFGEFARLK